MFSATFVLVSICLYVSILFFIAFWIEHSSGIGKRISNSSVIYSLSLAVYCTAWTYYGSVGKAATSGLLFITIYLGPTIAIASWWIILRKLVRLKNAHRVTSIADFISNRYNKSAGIAAIVTIIALIGNLPYIALQLKAVFSTFHIITNTSSPVQINAQSINHADLTVVLLLILFTIFMGVRRLDPTERHSGMMSALAFESIVKLIGFIAVGIFVTYFMHHGFNDIFKRILQEPALSVINRANTQEGNSYITWATYLFLSMSAIMFLPRQFHVSVVENSNENHIRTAMWLFPLYMLLINIFVLPIAMGGLLAGNPIQQADTFVLRLPIEGGNHWLSLLAFIGGFSAATGMVIASSMTISTMVTNHLVLPLITRAKSLGFLRRSLLQCRWLAVGIFILLGYWFEIKIGASYMLVNIGMISFAACMQLAPAILAGLFWRKANKRGAILGITSGFLVWFYTLMIPSFVNGGWIPNTLLKNGPWGISFLRPEHLFGVSALDPLTHGVFWSMLFNAGLLITGSIFCKQQEEEKKIADEFVNVLSIKDAKPSSVAAKAEIDSSSKRIIIENIFNQYLSKGEALAVTNRCFLETNTDNKTQISLIELAELQSKTEKILSGSIGAAAAHKALKDSGLFNISETEQLQKIYAEILANLKLTPEELKDKVDYYQERETLLTKHSLELEVKIKELEQNILERRRAEEELQKVQNELEKRVEERTRDLLTINEKLGLEIKERQETATALTESRQRLADIIDFLPDATFVIDKEGVVIAWNKATEEMTGAKAEHILGKGNYEHAIPFYGARRPVLANLLFQTDLDVEKKYPFIKKEKNVLLTETWLSNVNGKDIFVWAKAAPLYDSNGKVIAAIEVVRDITERKKGQDQLENAYEQLKNTQAQLMQSSKMAAVGQLASGVAHEINNPLTGVLNNVQLIKMIQDKNGVCDIKSFNELLDIIEESAFRCKKITQSLLDFSHVSKGIFQLISLNETADKVVTLVSHELTLENIAIIKELQPELPYITGDSQLLQQVIFDMITNAKWAIQKKNGKDGGTITIGTSYNNDNKLICVSISDNGIGISEENISKIFEPFFTTKPIGQGTGLGLAITYNIIKAHKGIIEVTSQPNQGTTFKIYLPVIFSGQQ